MLLPMFAVPGSAAETGAAEVSADSEVITLIAGSDFQPSDDSTATGQAQVTAILEQIKTDYPAVDGFLFCGDYDYASLTSAAESTNGKNALQQAVQAVYGTEVAEIYVQGNHDPDELVTGGTLSASGAHDADGYGVYVINEMDYMWYNNDETTIRNTAAALDSYLDAKVSAGYSNPIFVVSHLPLHYNMRTAEQGDGQYANYIFDVLNEAGASGLNIIFLFGHDHSAGWDDYLGGSAIYLAKGDSINIAQGSQTVFKTETLKFTYMNAGYVGYYAAVNNGSETDLTMTVFQIADGKVTISRYSADGIHDLKSVGVTNSNKNETGYDPDTRVYASPKTLRLNTLLQDEATGVVVGGVGLSSLTVTKGTSQVPAGYSVYQTYDILPEGHAPGNAVQVSIPADSAIDTSRPVLVIDHEQGKTMVTQVMDGYVSFTTDHFSMYTVAQAQTESVSASGTLSQYAQPVTELVTGKYYVITAYLDEWVLSGTEATTKDNDKGLKLDDEWVSTGDLWYYDGTGLRYGDTDKYLMLSYSTSYRAFLEAVTSDNQKRLTDSIFLNNDGETFTIKRTSNGYCLNQYGGKGYDEAAAYTQDGNTNSGSKWYFYELVDGISTTLTVTPSQNTVTDGNTVVMSPEVTVNGAAAEGYDITWESSDDSIATVDANGIVTPVKAGQVYIRATLNSVEGAEPSSAMFVEVLITVVEVTKNDTSVTATTVLAPYLVKRDEPVTGTPYVIIERTTGWVLTGNTGVNSGKCTGLEMIPENDFNHVWYYDGTHLLYGSETASDNYLVYANSQVTLGTADSGQVFDQIEKYDSTSTSYVIGITGQETYLNQLGGTGYNAAGVYSSRYYSRWYYYEMIPAKPVSLTVTPSQDILHPDETVTLSPTVTADSTEISDYSITWTSSDTALATVDESGKVTPASSKGGYVTITATLTVVDGVELDAPLSVDIPIQIVCVTSDDNGITASFIWEETLKKVTALQEGVPYVITNKSSGHVLTNQITKGTKATGLELMDLADDDATYLWYYESAGEDNGYLVYGDPNSGEYMVFADNQVKLGDSPRFDSVYLNTDSVSFTIANSSITNGHKYLNQYGGSNYNAAYVYSQDGNANGGSAWYFYQLLANQKVELRIAPYNAQQPIDQIQKLTATVWVDGVQKEGDYEIKWTSVSSNSAATVSNGIVTPKAVGDVVVTAWLTSVNGQTLPEAICADIPITITELGSVSISGKTGVTYVGSSQASTINQYLTVSYADRTTGRVPVEVGMLSDADGNAVSTGTAGVFENLTVTYCGVTVCTDFTLKVLERDVSDYPEFPDEGSVSVNKEGSGIDFQSSGIAQIELSATGVPSRKGADVIIMLDTSSSMISKIGGSEQSRLQVLTGALNNLIDQLQADSSGGGSDIRVAIADFNGYYLTSDSNYYLNENDTTKDNSIRKTSEGDDVYTGSQALNADAFVDVQSLGVDPFYTSGYTGTSMKKYTLTYSSGTNYDYAFDAVYQLGEAIQAENKANGEDRDLFVIFMSDGCPFQYNYFSSQSNASGSDYWNNWLLGTFTDEMYGENANKTYYNEDGLHWMAEAIKGDPNTNYPVIRKNDSRDTNGDNWIEVKGLGATMYSIGFCLADDGKIKLETMDTVIRNVASSAEYYYTADTASELEDAFSLISNEIFYAATNAYFMDTMGANYDLRLKPINYSVAVGESYESRTITPVIQVKSYSVYTTQDFMNGLCEESQIGTRKTDSNGAFIYTLLEEVTFNEAGTEAYSNVLGTGNILTDGVINASTFWYNTNSTSVQVTYNGKTITIPAETFCWKLGTISTTELCLSYYVYLTGSMEGTRAAGTYDTNEYAELFYTNYLGHDCSKTVPTPKLPWKQATVGYGFYLVDENGNPIVNQTTGETGSFEKAVRITQPVYQDFMLNSGTQNVVASILAGDNLPEGYTLFDSGAKYEVQLNSNGSGCYIIYTDANTGKQTTYVVGVETNAVTGGDSDGEKVETTNYTTANTVVWFGVVASVSCVPDTVVIDFGLSVDIHPLINDLMMPTGTATLAGIGAYTDSMSLERTDELNSSFAFGEDLTGKFGAVKAAANGAANTYDAAVCYTPTTMEMNTEEVFAYAVHYTGSVGTQGYYYSTVTVIPATTIYYEDSFVSYSVWNNSDDTQNEELAKQWKDTSDAADKTQAEDRPGEFSLSYADANNIYGYDGAYTDMAQYSMGSAKKVTVNEDLYAEAQFTFWGTGFDVISLTSNTTGTILVDVYDADAFAASGYGASRVQSFMVDTFYGYKREFHEVTYTYSEEEWIIAKEGDDIIITEDQMGTSGSQPENPEEGDTYTAYEVHWVVDPTSTDALYQVPVMKVDGLAYDKYTVVITAAYRPALDHQEDGSNDFYLDAIRIYDPANDGANSDVIKDAYVADGEGWPEYFELRDLIISKNDFNSLEAGTGSGIVFIDNTVDTDNNTTYSISDYTNYGPNNELYLAPGQAVAFDLAIPDNVAGIHLAMKSVGGTANVCVYDARDNTRTSQTPTTIATATDLYYDITPLNNKTVVIWNTGETGILSITNIKVTYKAEHTDGIEDGFFTYSNEGIDLSMDSLMLDSSVEVPEEVPETTEPENAEAETTVPVETEPEATEPETSGPETTVPDEEETEGFKPEKLEVRLSDSSVKVGSKVAVTVTTSADVAYITINGATVTDYTSSRNGNRTWKIRVPAENVGEMAVEVTAYNAEGLASEPVCETVEVTESYSSAGDWLKDLLIGVIGDLLGKWR